MTNLRRSALTTQFVTFREWADVGLDMTAPDVGFTLTGEPDAWFGTDWVGTTQQRANTDGSVSYYRDHRILVGPDDAATTVLTPGRWLVWRRLTDNPEVPTDLVSGTITIF